MNLKDQVREFVKFDVTDAHNLINDLAIGKKKFSMSIPAQQYDSDLVLQAPLDYINRLAPLLELLPEVVECLEDNLIAVEVLRDILNRKDFELGTLRSKEIISELQETLAKIKEAVERKV